MEHRVSEQTKIREGRGLGLGSGYKPWIRATEFPGHLGTHHSPIDWHHGRTMHLLSNGEYWMYLILRWEDDVIDIREQYPLPLEATMEIACKNHLRHPRVGGIPVHMTSDLLVDYLDGSQAVYSMKASKADFQKNADQVKNVWIEREYWRGQRVAYQLVYTDEMNVAYAENIGQAVYCWDPKTISDKVGLFKCLVAHKMIDIDLRSKLLDAEGWNRLANKYITDTEYPRLLEKCSNIAGNN